MLEPQRTRPLSHLDLPPVPTELQGSTLIDRGFPVFFQILTTSNQRLALAKRIDLDLTTRQICRYEQWTIFPVTPVAWAAIGSAGAGYAELAEQVGGHGLISEQRNSRNRFSLAGPGAEAILSKGCAVDFDPRVAHLDTWAQSLFNEIGVLIHRPEDAPAFDIYCYAGFAQSLWQGLMVAGREFGLQPYSDYDAKTEHK